MLQDEFQFYMRDAASKLLLVPNKGNKAAESAASCLIIPTATVSVSWTDGETPKAVCPAHLPGMSLSRELEQPAWRITWVDLPLFCWNGHVL